MLKFIRSVQSVSLITIATIADGFVVGRHRDIKLKQLQVRQKKKKEDGDIKQSEGVSTLWCSSGGSDWTDQEVENDGENDVKVVRKVDITIEQTTASCESSHVRMSNLVCETLKTQASKNKQRYQVRIALDLFKKKKKKKNKTLKFANRMHGLTYHVAPPNGKCECDNVKQWRPKALERTFTSTKVSADNCWRDKAPKKDVEMQSTGTTEQETLSRHGNGANFANPETEYLCRKWSCVCAHMRNLDFES
ncbi:hypothetical protein RFI_20196 [Reticulomyxa filosa]|uniref:Uncharacterized protein n=1 Tax=Reticulomyxa filosa TaxID=46433 RepID=X6MTY0_RETFI|nr:hypothetical protein RFI_20196 [Reticulomyxa filosa]|eukprot:ETO17136.1 hypothetical protein RFI_20196 [Reticulomyxa filosa]